MIGLLFRSRGSVVCSVHEHVDHDANVATRAEELVFLRDGFSWAVALFPPFTLLMRRAWIGLAAYVVAAMAVVFALQTLGVAAAWTVLGLMMLGIVFGFEATTLERWHLSRTGWDEIGVVSGADIEECERRFLDSWLPAQSPPAREMPGDMQQPSLLRRLFAARP